MSMKDKVQDAINGQINAEIYSAYLYYSMSAWYESHGLPGFAIWMRYQAFEEFAHANKFVKFLVDRGGKVEMQPVEAPPNEWSSPLDVFEQVCEHEAKVTALINGLVDLARAEGDHATDQFLQWFVTEQVEEEASADEIRQKLILVEDTKGALFMLDRDMGARTVTVPPELVA